MSTTVLVTGGAGFIGSNLIRWILHHRSWRVINLDALTYAGNLENLRDVESDPRYAFVYGRVEDAAAVSQVLQEYDVGGIIHCAA
ncbi:MAG: GDP-mannose 4,6-dehydratase, partial [Chlorobi bacterium]|nr:GDP-mannose 4,6-dehydratase [Chlorobiota bacterium]